MLRWFILLTCLFFIVCAAPAFADTVTLRTRIEASGPAITMGDVFDGAGDASGRALAPAPPPGQVSTLNVSFLVAAAESAGLDWTPPSGVTQVRVVRPGGARATLGPSTTSSRGDAGDVAIRRGETVTLLYAAPGLQISARARANEDGAVGQSIRLVNLTSNRTIDAVVTGPGAATASP